MVDVHELQDDMADNAPMATNAVVALLVREAVERVRPEVVALTRLLDELQQLAADLEEHGNDPHEAGSGAGDLLAVLACHLPNEVRGIAGNLQNTRDLLKLPVTAGGQP